MFASVFKLHADPAAGMQTLVVTTARPRKAYACGEAAGVKAFPIWVVDGPVTDVSCK
jgi:hypothetical protein